MKLSLLFFLEKLRAIWPEVQLLGDGAACVVESAAVLLPEQSAAAGVLYVDALHLETAPCCPLVTHRSRAARFSGSCVLAVPDAVSLTQVLEQLMAIFAQYRHWAESVCLAVARGAELQELIDLTAQLEENPMYIADRSWKVLAYCDRDMYDTSATWRYQRKHGYLPYHVMQKLIEAGELEQMTSSANAFRIESKGFVVPFVCKPIRKDGEHHGFFFIVEMYRRLNACDLAVADYLGELLASSVHNRRNYLEIAEMYHAHFIADMLDGTLTDPQLIADQGRALQMEPEGDYVLFLMAMEQDTEANRRHLIARLTADTGMVCLEYGEQVVAILHQATTRMASILEMLRTYAKRYRFYGAVSERFVRFADLKAYYEQARYAVAHGRQWNLPPQVIAYRDAYLDHLTTLSARIPRFCFVEWLDQYDKAHGTDYCKTLYVWLVCERNIVRSAGALYLHRNTMKYRLERIAELVPLSTDDLEVRIRMLLSLRQLLRERGELPEVPK